MLEVKEVIDKICMWEAIKVVRIKDRFSKGSLGGWRDCMINFVLVDDPNKHICELQVTHTKMMTQREDLKAHEVYGRVRNAGELLERIRMTPEEARLAKLKVEKRMAA